MQQPLVEQFYVSGDLHFASTDANAASFAAWQYADDFPEAYYTVCVNELGHNDFGQFVVGVSVFDGEDAKPVRDECGIVWSD